MRSSLAARPLRSTTRLVVGVLALVVALLLAACGSSGGGEQEGEASSGTTVSTKFGDVDVPEDPQRVVALGWGDAETALALGVQPVGASDWLAFGGEGVGPWAEGRYDQAPEIIDTLEPSYEKIAALEPDLILDVKSSGDQTRHDRLSEIATTVGVPEGGDNYLTSLDQQVTMISEALGKADEGRQLLDDAQQKFDDAKAEHPEFQGKTSTVAAYTSEGWGAYVEGSERVDFLTKLGFEQNPAVEDLEATGFSASISSENLDVMDSDLLVVFPIYVPASQVTDQAAYQNLSVVKDGRTVLFGDDQEDIRNAYSLNSILSVDYAIDQVVPLLSEAAGGRARCWGSERSMSSGSRDGRWCRAGCFPGRGRRCGGRGGVCAPGDHVSWGVCHPRPKFAGEPLLVQGFPLVMRFLGPFRLHRDHVPRARPRRWPSTTSAKRGQPAARRASGS
ncbi:iron-siderophore ABC transporter substrate-binding protein [Rothia sp. AR01]|uniref:Iron-siderophore ABC transporter substrate-binding protein n=1 Tax=Rothia santali TaxID=2949643 RepID=A0A9X2HAC4_9MICC|nr:iron-siderophore ABC transporter substrate-binding protein [Rothia santali]MCP3425646.1 iron-siderophore ABC transporter substrate-binding protein [Rothia santali]